MNKASFQQAKIFIYTDLEREIALARVATQAENGDIKSKSLLQKLKDKAVPHGGGNFMAALALLCYVEFAGKLKFDHKKPNGNDFASKDFNDFFDLLGPKYKTLRQNHNVYNLIRCGFAHEYYVKGNSTVAMFTDNDVGIWYDSQNTHYVIVIEKLFYDFKKAFDILEEELFPVSPKKT